MLVCVNIQTTACASAICFSLLKESLQNNASLTTDVVMFRFYPLKHRLSRKTTVLKGLSSSFTDFLISLTKAFSVDSFNHDLPSLPLPPRLSSCFALHYLVSWELHAHWGRKFSLHFLQNFFCLSSALRLATVDLSLSFLLHLFLLALLFWASNVSKRSK